MTDLVEASFDSVARARTVNAAIRYAGGSDEGWVQPSSSRLVPDPEGNLSAGALNAFGESHNGSSLDATIDTGEAIVGGAYLARDTQTTVTLSSSTNNQDVYVGWKDGEEDTVIVGKSGDFTSDDPKHRIWTFDTDSNGITSATDQRNLDNFRVRNEDVQGLQNFTSDETFSGHPIGSSDIGTNAAGSDEVDTSNIDADEFSGSNGTNGQVLQSNGTDASWATLDTDLNVREMYHAGLPTMARGDYFGDIYPGVLAAADFVTGTIITTAGTQMESFTTPDNAARGVTVDPSNGTLWHTDLVSDTIYNLERDGTQITSFSSPSSNSTGLGIDPADGTLWYSTSNSAGIYHLERDGTQINSPNPPGSNHTGIAVDPQDGTLWLSSSGNNTIYHVERDGTQITSFSSPSTSPQGIDVDPADGTIWHTDFDGDMIYNLERDGTQITSFSSPGGAPRGVGIDPTDGTIWHSDNSVNTIYHLNRFSSAYEVSVDGETFAMQKL